MTQPQMHIFASSHSPTLRLKMRLKSGEARYLEFKNGSLSLSEDKDDERELARSLMDLLKDPSKAHISQQVRYVDQAAADRIVRRHLEEQLMREKKASGPFSSAHATRHMTEAMKERVKNEMMAGGASDEEVNQALDQLSKDMPVSENGSGNVHRNEELITASNLQKRDGPQPTGVSEFTTSFEQMFGRK